MSDILLDIKNLNIVYSTTDGVVRAIIVLQECKDIDSCC